MKRLLVTTAVVAAVLPMPALAYDWSVSAKVTMIEISYAPNQLPFEIDKPAGSCAAGALLYWNLKGSDSVAKAQNYQAVLSALMTAKSSGQSVTIYGNNAGCTIDYIYLQ